MTELWDTIKWETIEEKVIFLHLPTRTLPAPLPLWNGSKASLTCYITAPLSLTSFSLHSSRAFISSGSTLYPKEGCRRRWSKTTHRIGCQGCQSVSAEHMSWLASKLELKVILEVLLRILTTLETCGMDELFSSWLLLLCSCHYPEIM